MGRKEPCTPTTPPKQLWQGLNVSVFDDCYAAWSAKEVLDTLQMPSNQRHVREALYDVMVMRQLFLCLYSFYISFTFSLFSPPFLVVFFGRELSRCQAHSQRNRLRSPHSKHLQLLSVLLPEPYPILSILLP